MSSISLRALVQQAVLGLAVLTKVAAMPVEAANSHESLIPRMFTRADGTKATVWENPAITFRTFSDSVDTPSLAKRLQYHTFTDGNGRNEYCGESNPHITTSDASPSSADCKAIADAYTDSKGSGVNGYWEIDAADFSNGPGGYVTLATSGSCKFSIRIADSGAAADAFFGANDVRFYINYALHSASNGKIEADAPVHCSTGGSGSVSIEYHIMHV